MALKSALLTIYILSWLGLQAQDITLSGRIISGKDKLPVQGARVSSSALSTLSDKFGRFEIKGIRNTVIKIFKEGFLLYEIAIDSSSNELMIRLEHELPVVSIGYHNIPKNQVLGSVGSVQTSDFNKGLISSPEQLIQGKVAGVQVTTGSGDPGSEIYTVIRGFSSIQITSPLFVLDDFPLWEENMYVNSTDFGRGQARLRDLLNFINPSDIERIDVLKDASATAIFGSRGSHGVVLIKTKDGMDTKNRLQFQTQISISNQRKYYDLLNREQFLNGIDNLGGNSAANDFGEDTNWQKEINQTSFSQRYDLSYSNSYKSGNYRTSLTYDNQPGIIQETGLKRLTGRVNWNHSMFDNRFQIIARLAGTSLHDEYAFITTSSGFQGDLLGATIAANPTLDNDPDFQPGINSNPLSLLKYYDDNSKTKNLLLNAAMRYSITPSINVGINAGINSSHSNREAGLSPEIANFNGVSGNGRATIRSLERRNGIIEAIANYQKVSGNSRLEVMTGYSFQIFNASGRDTEGWGFSHSSVSNMIHDLNSSRSIIRNSITQQYQQFGFSDNTFFITQTTPQYNTYDITSPKPTTSVRSVTEDNFSNKDEMRSLFGKVNYSFRSRYFMMATIRADESTLFGKNYRGGFFPSVSAAWRLSEEDFIPELFSELKFRVGIGRSGNQSIPHGTHSSKPHFTTLFINVSGDIPYPGISSGIANPDIKWEEMDEMNFGLDFGFFNSRLQGSLDLYKRVTKDFLYNQPLAQPSPIDEALTNSSGEIITTGLEFSLTYTMIRKNNFNASLHTNLAYSKSRLNDFSESVGAGNIYGAGLTGASVQRITENHPLYSFYLLKFEGFDNNGYSTYNNDGWKYRDKKPTPSILFNIGSTLFYKNWDAGVLFSGQKGHSIYNNTANAYFSAGSLANGRNVTQDILTSTESPVNSIDPSTRFLEDASFFRLQNVDLGYNFYFKRKACKAIRTFITGQNLIVWTNYSGLDPDIYTGQLGIDYSTYPKARTFTLGIQATF